MFFLLDSLLETLRNQCILFRGTILYGSPLSPPVVGIRKFGPAVGVVVCSVMLINIWHMSRNIFVCLLDLGTLYDCGGTLLLWGKLAWLLTLWFRVWNSVNKHNNFSIFNPKAQWSKLSFCVKDFIQDFQHCFKFDQLKFHKQKSLTWPKGA